MMRHRRLLLLLLSGGFFRRFFSLSRLQVVALFASSCKRSQTHALQSASVRRKSCESVRRRFSDASGVPAPVQAAVRDQTKGIARNSNNSFAAT
jgi:hypothetical protein